MKVYEIDVPVTVNTIAIVTAENETDAILSIKERFKDKDEFAQYLHSSVHWFTDDRFVKVHTESEWWCCESELLRWDEKLNDAVPTEQFKGHIFNEGNDDEKSSYDE